MARTMKVANQRLFARLSSYCSVKGEHISVTSGYKYLEGDDENDRIIKDLVIQQTLLFGPRRAAAHMVCHDEHYIALLGFDYLDEFVNTIPALGDDVEQVEFKPGHAVVLMGELDVQPARSALEVANYVNVAHSDVIGYEGHGFDEIKRLFPEISIFRCRAPLGLGEFDQILTKFAAAESVHGGSWLDLHLLDDIMALAALSAPSFPYDFVSRAAFDSDPRAMYMALYRCIEATYALSKSTALADKLDLDLHWSEMAIKLETVLKWRPRERESLEAVLALASEQDLERIVLAFGKKPGSNLATLAADQIYALRNEIVHYGAGRKSVEIASYDWNVVCGALIGIVYDVFNNAFEAV